MSKILTNINFRYACLFWLSVCLQFNHALATEPMTMKICTKMVFLPGSDDGRMEEGETAGRVGQGSARGACSF